MAGIRVSRSKVIDKTREMDQQLGGAKVAAERTMQALLLAEEESGTLIGEAWDSVRDYVEQIQRPLNSLYINWINAQFEGNRKLRDEASYLPVEDMQEDYFKSQIRHYRTIIARERKKEFPNHTLIHYCKKKIDMYEQFLNMLYNFVSRTDSAYDKAEYYGVMLSGEFGVSPLAIDEYFEKEGYDTIMLANDVSENLESLALASDVVILSVYNNKYSICDQVHTICVTKEKRAYCAHNVYHKENKEYAKIGPYKTIQEVVENLKDHHNSAVISAIGINKMRGEEK